MSRKTKPSEQLTKQQMEAILSLGRAVFSSKPGTVEERLERRNAEATMKNAAKHWGPDRERQTG
jgi:hypothetical protein